MQFKFRRTAFQYFNYKLILALIIKILNEVILRVNVRLKTIRNVASIRNIITIKLKSTLELTL